jgi:hypothetical protein
MTRLHRRIVTAAVGAAALLIGVLGGIAEPDEFFRAWLAGFAGSVGLSLGALMLLMAHDLTGGRWGLVARPPLAAAAAMMPFNIVLFVPLLFGLSRLYPWARPEPAAELANRFYLNPGFFVVRAFVYFVLWLGASALTLAPAERDDAGQAVGRLSSAPGLIVVAVTATFSAFDWTMSLEPDWSSSIYGLFVTASDLGGALAAATLAAILMTPASRAGNADPDPFNDLGSLLLAGIVLEAYLAAMQLVIIWEENLPDEIPWYLRRIADGWQGVDWALLCCAVAPFAILIAWPLKRRRFWLGTACTVLLVGYLLTQWWLVLPPHKIGWLSPVVLVAIGGFWLALFDSRLERGRPYGTELRRISPRGTDG